MRSLSILKGNYNQVEKHFLVLLLSFISVKIGLWMSFPPYFSSPLWPAFGIGLGICILFGKRLLPAIFLGYFIGFLLHDYSTVLLFKSALFIAAHASTIGVGLVWIKYVLLRRLIHDSLHLSNPAILTKFFVLLFLFEVLTYVIILLIVNFYAGVTFGAVKQMVLVWSGADLTGSMLFVPLVLSFSYRYRLDLKGARKLELALLLLVVGMIGWVSFTNTGLLSRQLPYLFMPFFFYVSYRFSIKTTLIVIFAIVVITTLSTIKHTILVVGDEYFNPIFIYQLYFLFLIPLVLIVNASINKLKQRNIIVDRFIKEKVSNYGRAKTGYAKNNETIAEDTDKFKSIAVEHSPGSIIITDGEGVIKYANPAFEKISGYSVSEVLGKNPRVLNSGYHPEAFFKELWETIEGGRVWNGTILNKKKDGTFYWEQATISPVFIKENNFNGFICTKEDITIRKNNLHKLKLSEHIFKTLAKNIPVVVMRTNTDAIISYVNKRFLGLTPKNVIGYEIYKFLDGPSGQLMRSSISHSVLNKEINQFKTVLTDCESNKLHFVVRLAPIVEKDICSGIIIIWQDITEMVSNREEMESSESKYKLLAENVADVIWVVDKDLNFSFISPSIDEIAGYSIKEFLGLKLTEYLDKIPRRLLVQFRRLKGRRLEEGVQLSDNKITTELIRKDGRKIWVESKMKILLSENNYFDGIIGVSRDETKQKKSEFALKESEEKFKSFFENTNVILFIINPINGKVESSNEAARNFYGYTKTEMDNLYFYDLSPLNKSQALENLKNIQTTNRKLLSYKHRLKNGRVKDVEIYPTPVYVQGQLKLFTIIQDVTRRKKAVAALKESELKKLALLKIIPDLIMVINRNGIVIDIYTDYPDKLPVPPDKVLGNKFSNVIPKEVYNEFTHYFEAAFATREVKSFEYSFTTNDNLVHEEARFIMSGDDELLAIIRDITRLKRNEIELKRAWEEAEDANNAKSAFLANISHEIRTPLNSIVGFAELINYEIKDQGLKGYLKSIKTSSNSLLTLINDLLDLSKIEAGELSIKKSYFNIRSLLEEVKNIFLLKIERKDLDFIIDIPDYIPLSLYLDETRVRQILINLVGNAVKFTEKGFVKIIISGEKLKGNGEHRISISVVDSGIGISEENYDIIFEAFKQQEQQDIRKYGGTGLGLTITKRLVEKMNGSISIESNENKGSKFTVTFKSVETSDKKDFKEKRSNKLMLDEIVFEYSVIILVSADPDLEEILKCIFKESKLFCLKDFASVNDIMDRNSVDLIVLDSNMMDGHVAVPKRLKTKKIPLVAILGEKEGKVDNKLKFSSKLSRPIDMRELITELSKYLNTKPNTQENGADELDHVDMGHETIHRSIAEKEKIKDIIKHKILPAYKKVSSSSSFDEIKEFASEINKFGNAYGLKSISDHSKDITEATKNFDIDEIMQQMAVIKKILKQLLNL